jgi:uncharacterized protein RhaS with RHS repeats
MRARWYDPGTGQFLSQDPLVLLTQQPYAYVSDNPLNATDSSGLARGIIEGGGDGLSVSESAINAAPPDAASGFGQTVTSDTNPGQTAEPSTEAPACNYSVYTLQDGEGNDQYVGRTMDSARRAIEHANSADEAKRALTFVPKYTNLTYQQARGLEQFEINANGGITNLLNKINAVSASKWSQFEAVVRDYLP